ncbi:MAG: HD domain-containing protein [Azonexus sp.]|jgi:HD-GYP domain-containing protein (c-di-GMP phosphodiesterase class II)|uniref:HD domain-containing phosphohydrolase n=1 Tax=Azonexus sp. TaxID=1872668 RepID=UPI002839A604|nr:HD domain-containing phosphohydrolase [Azonexus sp.]MDR0777808.1 HD domain-containing protein [Azonexus sp.]
MDTQAFVAPVIQDREALEEFADALTDRAPEVERDVARLLKTPADQKITGDLFRSIHNIKGDASLCKFALGVTIAHLIESVMERFRGGEIAFTELLAELILLTVDRLELATEDLLHGKPLDKLRLPELLTGLEQMAQASPEQVDTLCAELIEVVTGFPSVLADIPMRVPQGNRHSHSGETKSSAADLQFFRSLALQLESRSPLFKGRTMRILRLALETNKAAGSPVNPQQLEAAVYLHDVGMMFLPESVWLKVGKMTDHDKQLLHSHPGLAAGLLLRIPGWEGAAEMVAQHHEMPDGAGYPQELASDAICAGAKILSIVDAFESVMLKHIHRGKNRSVLRAIAEINACDKQFAPEWIAPFNVVIRKTIET